MLLNSSPKLEGKTFYRLSPEAYHCEIAGAVIFLHAGADRYLMLDRAQSEWFRQICEGALCAHASDKAFKLASRLMSAGILIRQPEQTGRIEKLSWRPPTGAISDLAPERPKQAPRVQNALRMAQAFAASTPYRRKPHIAAVLAAARRWKMKTSARPAITTEHVAEMVGQFHTLSPLFFSAHDACLFRSILLLRYLTLRGVCADLVFGVRLSPFMAHCWIEHRRTVLNDHLENTASFTPILAV